MTKICIIGNSHVGSLKRGWNEIWADYPEQEITFFAQRSDGINDLVALNGKLIPDNEKLVKALEFTSAGKKEIDPIDYDVFVIYGAGANINFINDNQFYSSAVIKSSLIDLVTNTVSFAILKRLRNLTNKAIFIGHIPLVAAVEILSESTPSDYIARVELLNNLIYRPLRAELVLQPLSTIVNGNNTHPSFSKGSKSLAIGDNFDNKYHPDDDNEHMNDKFGEIWLRKFIKNYLEKAIRSEVDQ